MLSALIRTVPLVVLLIPVRAWGWGSDGHYIAAVIAADNLTPAAQSHVASVLGVPTDKIAAAMEAASIRPDSEFREEDPSTKPWHFIDICLIDRRIDVSLRCPGGNCVTGKIDEYAQRLKEGHYDRWGADGDLAFLIHFVADLHQPLHAANDQDLGGNCVLVESQPRARNLHAAWDTMIVRNLERTVDSGSPETTAHKLEQKYASERPMDVWIRGRTDDIAWESNQIARSEIYVALRIPIEPCEPPAGRCGNEPDVDLSPAYLDQAGIIAGHQLAKAGFRLASLLNQIWTQPTTVGWNGAARGASSDEKASVSSKPIDAIVGNRRSHIYAWPGCGSYDTMAPQNRVVFPSSQAAEQAGYRAAYNCPR
jgi:S1/P1 Nuclease/Metal binding domain of Ada